ncbi:fumarylacetoacetate hydrolase family protein [Streptomyces sp. NRRL_B-16638]|jgi:2-keto-4-pentenoate hydratase|uniref:Hydratase n=2 Tax=Streptomyces coelicolor TaxID=1902 RepID=Q99Q80_STRCO|nr:fumarylacetoacetate hydrolase family protein [Streptomyces sp. NRRL_B-16638]AGO88519.1 hydratase [Streptomyces coelicolor]MDX2928872.1 fumarylacetoacetate hydrolase family protein [Streptomyces sp. NRRL_B-16638]CAC36577.1 putative hydratase [Streptomyces coelicolor A3(2)]CAC36824.1 putative hydratase [Streptomyces coelicolor A3(2)]
MTFGPESSDARGVHLPAEGSTPSLDDLAAELRAVRRTGLPCLTVSSRFPELDVEAAYRIQLINAEHRVRAGARTAGYKIGLTSRAMQQQMGIHEPDSGVIHSDALARTGSHLRADAYRAPRIETELAFILGQDLAGPADLSTVRAAISEYCLAYEILDTSYGTWNITLVDSVADNAACAGVITGPRLPFGPHSDPRTEQITVHADGKRVAAGSGRDILGDPVLAVHWLTRRRPQLRLRAGDIVLAGSVHASLPLTPGRYHATSSHLPALHLHVI